MNLKKLIFVAFCCSLLVAFFWSCAGPKEAVKVEEPEKKKVVEPEKEIAKTVEPEVEYKPEIIHLQLRHLRGIWLKFTSKKKEWDRN